MDTINSKLPQDVMSEYRLYVTCQIGDDVAYIVDRAGESTISTPVWSTASRLAWTPI